MNIIKLMDEDFKLKELNKMQFANDILIGLTSTPKKFSSKYFYDVVGSQLFQDITRLDEYYLTRKEYEIIESMKDQLPDIVGKEEIDIVELGVGDGHKTKLVIESFLKKNIKVHFYPIDISVEALNQLKENISEFTQLDIEAIAAEYLQGLTYVRQKSDRRQVVLFLGSNIGNFSRAEERDFLKKIKDVLHPEDFLLIGFDLKKDIETMTRAYSDSEGVTAHFNLNLLERINKELGANFQVENFRHLAQYNPILGAMESFLISLKDQDVTISQLARTIHFDAFEAIHMEYSFKFSEKEIRELSHQGGFEQVANFSDKQHFYVDSLWQVT